MADLRRVLVHVRRADARPATGRPAEDRFDPDRVGLDHVSFRVGSVDDLHAAVERLDAAGIDHGDVTDLPPFGLVILSVQDPDDVNLEFAAPRP
ncbi:VOC family protein [Sphingomonas sp. LR61]|uniref:VOC family protein n=1 Tax=Sphingomonas sp. LR61 TaxID=3050234 RepID=UPI003FA7C44A